MKKLLMALPMLVIFAVQAADITNPPEKIVLCAACHGSQGISANADWPNIAGQHANYLLKELQDFKSGKTRNSPPMTPLMATLSEQEMIELAAYYSKMPVAENSTPVKYLKRGEQIYRGGDFAQKITACIACHGPKGTGNGQAGFPMLSGQHAQYTIGQLQLFKDGKRSNDLNGIMQDISAHMSAEDMEAVAYYIQGLH